MAFDKDIKEKIHEYTQAHLADDDWHLDYFSYLGDTDLSRRLGEEFVATRYLYKFLEGMEAGGWLHRSQIKIQILSYASIYEAAIHHILFDLISSDTRVKSLMEFPQKIKISIPTASQTALQQHLGHDGKKIIPTYEGIGRTSNTKVRFDRKAECACELGLIDSKLKDELIQIYEARNAIHIHAEIRKSLDYHLDISKTAYRRMKIFKEQTSKKMEALHIGSYAEVE